MTSPEPRAQRPYRGSLGQFFVLTHVLTWAIWGAALAVSGTPAPGAGPAPGVLLLVLVGTFSPSVVALALTARHEGGDGVRALLGRLILWRVSARWYGFAIGCFAAVQLTGALLHRLVAGAWPRFGFEGLPPMLAATALSTVVGGQAGEEIGWRGYALPRLAARFGLGPACLLLGLVWAGWHLPLFFLPGASTYGQSFLSYLLKVVGISVAIGWLYWRTGGSLLLTMLMHAAINNTKDIVPTEIQPPGNIFAPSPSLLGWLTLVPLSILAAVLLVRMSRADRNALLNPSRASAGPDRAQ